jgi:ATP-dependent RNA helicase DDX35
MLDPLLSRYSVVMVTQPCILTLVLELNNLQIDEAHERGIYTDLLLGILKKYVIIKGSRYLMSNFRRIRRKRPSLRVIISSATLDVSSLLEYFSDDDSQATVISLEGRMYPVEVAYLEEPVQDYTEKAADVAWSINLQV